MALSDWFKPAAYKKWARIALILLIILMILFFIVGEHASNHMMMLGFAICALLFISIMLFSIFLIAVTLREVETDGWGLSQIIIFISIILGLGLWFAPRAETLSSVILLGLLIYGAFF